MRNTSGWPMLGTFLPRLIDALKSATPRWENSTVHVVWRHTSFVCRKNLRGSWNAAPPREAALRLDRTIGRSRAIGSTGAPGQGRP